MKTKELALDVGSTVATGGTLFGIGAPWWVYGVVLLFGACQKMHGRLQMQQELNQEKS